MTAIQPTVPQTDFNPFPGLRPFDANENHLFFGRDGQSDEILISLRQQRFVAVVGTSGSGKSSLIRAGLLPLLHGGFMSKASSNWRVAIFRPGSDPIGNLAAALNARDVFGTDTNDLETSTLITETTLRRSGLGLIEAVRQARMPDKANLLIVVDQFEELFRFKSSGNTDRSEDDAAFVKLLIEAAQQTELPIFCVITMRSDFIGDCARFRQLPETINRGLYLIPIMTRDQRREAITAPAAVAGAEIAPRLINRVLNDAGENPEKLPLLQHALMRTWAHWKSSHKGAGVMDLDSYEEIGGLSDALSRHADQAYHELPEARQKIAERIFRALTEKGAGNREVRRPKTVAELCAITEAAEPVVMAIIENFRRPGRSFLMPPAEVPLTSETLIDISHESLIGGWERLSDWVDTEGLSAGIYRRIADTAELYEKNEAALWRDPDLQVALGWRDKAQPNKVWGEHYHPGFDAAMNFLDKSEAARDASLLAKEKQRVKNLHRTQAFATVLTLLFVTALVLAIYAFGLRSIAVAAQQDALRQAESARQQTAIAQQKEQEADRAKEEAELQRQQALASAEVAKQERSKAEAEKRKADENARRAVAAAKEARKQKDIADARNNLFRAAVVDAEESNLVDMNTISFLTNELISLSSPEKAVKWRTWRAEALTNKRSHAEAEAEYAKVLEVKPDYAEAMMSRGYMYMLTDRFPESINDFDRVIAGDPRSSLGYLNRGLSQAIMGGYAEASASVSKAIETFIPGNYGSLSENQVSPAITRATGYRRLKADENAFQTALHYELVNIEAFRGGRDFEKHLRDASRGHASDSAYLSAINWAWLHMDKRSKDYGGWVSQGAMWEVLGSKYCGEAAYAYAQFQKTYKKDPDPRYRNLADFAKRKAAGLPCPPARPLPQEDAQELSLAADLAIDRGQLPEAQAFLTKAIASDSHNVDLLLKRADVFNKQMKFPESSADAEEVIRQVGDHPKALIFRALASTDDTVIETNLRKVLRDHPSNVDALYWLSQTVQEKNPGEAIKLLDQAISLQPYADNYFYLKAQLQAKTGRYSEARQSIENAIVIDAYVTEYYDERAAIEQHLSTPPTKIARNLIEGYNKIADLHLRRGDAGAAMDTYGKSLTFLAGASKSPGSDEIQCDIALTIHKTAKLIEQQGASNAKIIDHLRFMFGNVQGLEGALNAEVRLLLSLH